MKKDPFKKLLNNCKSNGRHSLVYHNVEQPKLLITAKDLQNIWEAQEGKCFWFGVTLDLGLLFKDHPDWFPVHPLAPSVDRKDDDADYSAENIVICCRFANLGRCIYPFDKTRQLVETLKGNQQKVNLDNFLQ
jgi:hypothetical protein